MKSVEKLGPESFQSPPGKKIIIFNKRTYGVLNLAAQGCTNEQIGEQLYISKTTVDSELSNAQRKLDTQGKLQTTQKGIDLSLISRKKNLENFDPRKLDLLTKHQRRIIDVLIDNWGEDSSLELTSRRLGKNERGIMAHFGKLYHKLNLRNKVQLAAIYKALQPNVVREERDTLVFVDQDVQNDKDTLSETDIILLLQLKQGQTLDDLVQAGQERALLDAQLSEISGKIATPARLAALEKGLETGLIYLPAKEDKPQPYLTKEESLFLNFKAKGKKQKEIPFSKIQINQITKEIREKFKISGKNIIVQAIIIAASRGLMDVESLLGEDYMQRFASLKPREKSILQALIANQGEKSSNQEIGEALSIPIINENVKK